jgi:hypothetical protein
MASSREDNEFTFRSARGNTYCRIYTGAISESLALSSLPETPCFGPPLTPTLKNTSADVKHVFNTAIANPKNHYFPIKSLKHPGAKSEQISLNSKENLTFY